MKTLAAPVHHHSPSVTARAFAVLVTLLCIALVLAGCSNGAQKQGAASEPGKKPLVLTTFTVIADMAQNVAGDHLRIESITKPGAEIHEYEPTPSDIKKASQADLILDNGLGLERWFEQFVQHSGAKHVVVSEGVKPIDITEDAYAGKPNPHAWMSPLNAQIYVDNIVRAFSELDPAHAEDYKRNGEAYKKKLQGIQDSMVSKLSTLPENERMLVTCEGAFSYLARDAGLKEQYIWAVNADQQGTPQQIARTINAVKENKVPAVFCESTVSDKQMQQVARSSGARFGGVLYVDSLSEKGGPVPTYLDMISHDADVITKGLTGKAQQ